MTGLELLEGLSFVDERYIQEAETAKLNQIPWMKWISMAACLCILVVGAFAFRQMDKSSAFEAIADAPAADAPAADAPAADAPAADAPAAEEPAAAAPKEDDLTGEPEHSLSDASQAKGELFHVSYARLRVVSVLDDGSLEAIAEATQDMEVDTQVTVVVDPSKVPGAEETAVDAIGVVAGALIEIYDGAYDADSNTLYVAGITPAE